MKVTIDGMTVLHEEYRSFDHLIDEYMVASVNFCKLVAR